MKSLKSLAFVDLLTVEIFCELTFFRSEKKQEFFFKKRKSYDLGISHQWLAEKLHFYPEFFFYQLFVLLHIYYFYVNCRGSLVILSDKGHFFIVEIESIQAS